MRPKILVTRVLPGDVLKKLESIADVETNNEERELTKSELIDKIRDKQAVISMLVNPIDAEVMEAAPELKIISNYAVGYNNIDVQAATDRGILVTNTPDVLTDATADMTWALLLGIARRIPEGDRFMREGRYVGWYPTLMLGGDVTGKSLGIVGMGRIGQAVAARAAGFQMRVLYHNRNRLDMETEQRLNAEYVSLEELLRVSDFVSIHSPYRAETHHMIGQAQLALMKKSAYLINTSRGPLIHERALIAALRNKDIAGAALDVFEFEPLMEPGLDELDNVVLAPHLGSATIETRKAMADIAVRNVIAALQNKRPSSPVNPEVLQQESNRRST